MTVHKKVYIGGKIIHRIGGGILLDAKRDLADVKHTQYEMQGNGLSSVALQRLEALKPRIQELPKRQNIKF